MGVQHGFSALAALSVLFSLCARGGEPGLVAHYTFDESSGSEARDTSGHGLDGTIHGARFIANGGGFALEFDGADDYVDAGHGDALNLKETVSLEAWVRPDGRPPEGAEPGILGKSITSYMLTYYGADGCYFYITEGANNLRVTMLPDNWNHIVATFDGSQMKLYLNGKLAESRTLKTDAIAPGKDFYIGCSVGDTRTDEGPAHPRTAFFKGAVDEVRVYDRALAAGEVINHFQEGIGKLGLLAAMASVIVRHKISADGVSVGVGEHGELKVDTPDECFVLETTYSYPGEKIGWNGFAIDPSESESGWTVESKKVSEDTLKITASGRYYRIVRTVRIRDGKIKFEDQLTNLSDEPIGFIVWNDLTTEEPFLSSVSPDGPGYSANPSILLTGATGKLGIMMEDNISRMRLSPVLGVPANRARFRVNDLTLDVGKSYSLRWSLYAFDGSADVFTFINRVREEYGSNFTVDGSFTFFHPAAPKEKSGWWLPWKDPKELKAYLQRKRVGIIGFLPFLDYDPGFYPEPQPRDEYKRVSQEIVRAIKEADPSVKCIGAVECDWVALDPKKIRHGDKLPAAQPEQPSGEAILTAEQTRILEESDFPWKDSAKRNAEGNFTMEIYARGPNREFPQAALAVYPAVGNHQYEYLKDQIEFILDDVGFDGFYIDQFSMVWSTTRTYGGWDGWSAHIDPSTGKISRKYIDANLLGIDARVNLCRLALDRGKIVVANTYATSQEEQALPVNRFSEVWNAFDPMATADGEMPPEVPYLYQGCLASPIALGVQGNDEAQDNARRTMKAVIGYLRHGMVYYHYHIGDIPESGKGSGEYGPINTMFPITPVELHRGWIRGEERTITCVSGEFDWDHPERPAVNLFDLEGRAVTHGFVPVQTDDGWLVPVELKDWAQIAVIH
jgi:hypothetical protein